MSMLPTPANGEPALLASTRFDGESAGEPFGSPATISGWTSSCNDPLHEHDEPDAESNRRFSRNSNEDDDAVREPGCFFTYQPPRVKPAEGLRRSSGCVTTKIRRAARSTLRQERVERRGMMTSRAGRFNENPANYRAPER